MDAALLFSGLGPDGVVLTYEAFFAETNEPVSYMTQATLSEASVLPSDDAWERVGDRVVFDIGSPDDVVGVTIILSVTATLTDQIWTDERQLVVVDDVP
jgi:hypothetical protein